MKYNKLKQSAVGGMLALALMAAAVPAPRAEAATLSELQAQIQSLLAQITALQVQISGSSSVGPVATFMSDLTVGRSGLEVTNLQKFLVSNGFTIPAGATGYFGEQTRSALAQFQAQHSIFPTAGYFGPVTRAKVNAMAISTPTPIPGDTDSDNDVTDQEPLKGGEAIIGDFEVKTGDDTNLQEGEKNASVMEVQFDVEDGDIQISRIDLGFTPENSNTEHDPWDVFSEVSLWNDGERIARVDASDDDNWDEDSPTKGDYKLRFNGLKWTVREGDTVDLVVKVTTHKNIKGVEDGESWDIFVPDNGIRALDSEKSVVYAGDTKEIVTIDIDESGSRDELIVKRSDAESKVATLQLKDNARSGWIKVLAFDLDTDDSASDIEIRKLPIELTVSSETVGTFMRDARIKVDGKTYTKKNVTDGATNTMLFEFNRGQFVIDGGDTATVEVEIEFNALAASHEGVTLVGEVDASGIVAKGSDNLGGSQISGTVKGMTHVLRTTGIVGEVDSSSASVTSVNGPDNDYASYVIEVEVTAFGQDVYIPNNAAQAVTYQLENSASVLGDTGIAILSSSAREQGDYFRISEGDTETITLEVTYKPGVGSTAARLQLLTIEFAGEAVTPDQSWNAVPSNDYRTPTKIIVD